MRARQLVAAARVEMSGAHLAFRCRPASFAVRFEPDMELLIIP